MNKAWLVQTIENQVWEFMGDEPDATAYGMVLDAINQVRDDVYRKVEGYDNQHER